MPGVLLSPYSLGWTSRFTDEESISESDSFLSFTEHDVSAYSNDLFSDAESDTCLSAAENSYCTTDADLSASSSSFV